MKTYINSAAVAKKAGVSKTVVSMVINGKADRYKIAKSTQKRVHMIIDRMNYKPDRTLHNAFLKRTEIEGKTDPAIIENILSPVLEGTGYRILVVPVEEKIIEPIRTPESKAKTLGNKEISEPESTPATPAEPPTVNSRVGHSSTGTTTDVPSVVQPTPATAPEPPQPANPANPVNPVQPPSATAPEPPQAANPANPVNPVQPPSATAPEPATPANPANPVNPVQPPSVTAPEPATPANPANPANPVQTPSVTAPEPATPANPANPVNPVQPSPATAPEPATPANPVNPVQPPSATAPEPPQAANPANPVNPVQPPPATAPEPPQAANPANPVNPVQPPSVTAPEPATPSPNPLKAVKWRALIWNAEAKLWQKKSFKEFGVKVHPNKLWIKNNYKFYKVSKVTTAKSLTGDFTVSMRIKGLVSINLMHRSGKPGMAQSVSGFPAGKWIKLTISRKAGKLSIESSDNVKRTFSGKLKNTAGPLDICIPVNRGAIIEIRKFKVT